MVLLLVSLVQLQAGLQVLDQLQGAFLPQALWLVPIQHALLAVRDHLLRNLREQVGHPLGSVVIPGDCVDHLDRVHERGERVDNCGGRTRVQRVDELLQRREVLDVVLGLVVRLGDGDVDLLPPPERVEDRLPRLGRHVLAAPGAHLQHVDHRLPLLGSELFGDGGYLLQPGPPEVELRARARVAGLLLLALERLLEVVLDLAAPVLHEGLAPPHQLRVLLGSVAGHRPALDLQFCRVWAGQVDAAGQGLDAV
mmetsp:Transcript_29962/g.85653  ORF Transcript_29962/g.85653 Transcript_29962/m.85653 type:complete len:253 (-) Transcript_29962:15-773(-)